MDNYIQHFGIKGMKWGVRRYQNKDGTLTKLGKDRYEKVKRKEMKDASKYRRILSEGEIKTRIERIRLERQLKDITDEELSPGKKMVKKILVDSGQRALTTMATGGMLYGTRAALTKKFDVKELAEYMTPKPKNK